MRKKNFTQKEKLTILKGAEKINVRGAAKVAGVHYTTVYDWRKQLAIMGEKAFLEYQVSKPGRGVKQISPEKEQAVLKEWENNPGFGPGQIRNQLRRQRITISTKSVRKLMQANGYNLKVTRDDPAWLQNFIINGCKIYCGFDADRTGDTMANKMIQRYPSIKRLRPPGHDWNEVLQASFL